MPYRKATLEAVKKYIRNTEPKAIVTNVTYVLSYLTKAVMRDLNLKQDKVYITTRCLKHLYDKKTAQEFDFICMHVHNIVRYPDNIYKNKSAKRGTYCFIKTIKGNKYFCSIEFDESAIKSKLYIATVFKVSEKYLKNYEFLWSWKGGIPSS